jgi:hypothetical protein
VALFYASRNRVFQKTRYFSATVLPEPRRLPLPIGLMPEKVLIPSAYLGFRTARPIKDISSRIVPLTPPKVIETGFMGETSLLLLLITRCCYPT